MFDLNSNGKKHKNKVQRSHDGQDEREKPETV
jgi:hypothetical protein